MLVRVRRLLGAPQSCDQSHVGPCVKIWWEASHGGGQPRLGQARRRSTESLAKRNDTGFEYLRRSFPDLQAGLVVERVGDVRIHAPDLAAGRDEHDDDHQGDQDQDEAVFDHSLTFLPGS